MFTLKFLFYFCFFVVVLFLVLVLLGSIQRIAANTAATGFKYGFASVGLLAHRIPNLAHTNGGITGAIAFVELATQTIEATFLGGDGGLSARDNNCRIFAVSVFTPLEKDGCTESGDDRTCELETHG